MATQDSLSPSDQVVSFLVAEYELLKDVRASIIAQNENRLNLFIAVASGGAALMAFFKDKVLCDDAFHFATLLVMFSLLVVGLSTSRRLIEGSISIVTYTRGLNRIRRYFSEVDQKIVDYLMLPINDDVPRFGAVGFLPTKGPRIGYTVVPILASSALIGGIIGIILDFVPGIASWLVVAAGFAGFLLSFIAHRLYYKRKMEEAHKNTVVMFPVS